MLQAQGEMSRIGYVDKLKEPKVPCTICSKELTKKYMKNHMDKIHIDKDHQKVAAKRGGELLINDLMSDIIQVAVNDTKTVEKDIIAAAAVKDLEDDKDTIDAKIINAELRFHDVKVVEVELHDTKEAEKDANDQEEDKDTIENTEEVEVELQLRDIHEQLSQEVKADQARVMMVPDEEWTKTLNSNDMEAQLEVLSSQLLNGAGNDNPVDEDNTEKFEENTRSCSFCNKRFEWMAQLFKHVITEHKKIESETTDPMWYMVGELMAEVRDEQVSLREDNEDFSRGMRQTMNLLTQTLTKDMMKRIKTLLSTNFPHVKNIYICDVCSFESENKEALKSHFHCRDCNEQMESMDGLAKHVQIVHKDKPEEEEDLKKKIKDMETLKIEVDNLKTLLKEQGQEILIKNAVIESFKDVEEQKNPNKGGGNKTPDDEILTTPDGSSVRAAEAPKMDKVGKNRCNACDRVFNTNKDLDNHVEAKHNEEVSVLSVPCVLCQKEFTTKKHMENHKRRCLQHICPSCGEIFRNKVELNKHKEECELIRTHDQGWKEKSKEVCFHWKRGRCFKSDDECKFSHVGPTGGHQQQQRVQGGQQKQVQGGQRRHHQQQKRQGGPVWAGGSQATHLADEDMLPRLTCTKCKYVMNTQNKLVYHMENSHNHASFKCDNCPQMFVTSEALVTHITKEHTRYQQQERRNMHLIESQINCIDWSCSFCGEKLKGKELRDKHMCHEHPAQLNKNNRIEECRRGPNCHHWRAGTCWFAHAQNVETPVKAQVPRRNTRRSNIWCSFQDKCDRRQSCSFRHIDEEKDFIQKVWRGAGW